MDRRRFLLCRPPPPRYPSASASVPSGSDSRISRRTKSVEPDRTSQDDDARKLNEYISGFDLDSLLRPPLDAELKPEIGKHAKPPFVEDRRKPLKSQPPSSLAARSLSRYLPIKTPSQNWKNLTYKRMKMATTTSSRSSNNNVPYGYQPALNVPFQPTSNTHPNRTQNHNQKHNQSQHLRGQSINSPQFPSSDSTSASASASATASASGPQYYDPMIHGQRPMLSPPPSRSAPNNPDPSGSLAIGLGVGGHPEHQRHGNPNGHSHGNMKLESYSMMGMPSGGMSISMQQQQQQQQHHQHHQQQQQQHRQQQQQQQQQQQRQQPPIEPQGDLHVPVGISGGKLFRCMGFDGCEMTFTRSEHLARHVRKHTGERPFPCHCGKSFSRLDNLRQHSATVHSDSIDLNERMLRTLAPVHAALSQRAGKEQKKRGEVLELPKQAIPKHRNNLANTENGLVPPYPVPAAAARFKTIKKQAKQAKQAKQPHRVGGMTVPPTAPISRQQQDDAIRSASTSVASMHGHFLPQGWQEQRPGSASGRPATAESIMPRPPTGTIRPSTAVPRPQSGVKTSMPQFSQPVDENDPHFAHNPFPYGIRPHTNSFQPPRVQTGYGSIAPGSAYSEVNNSRDAWPGPSPVFQQQPQSEMMYGQGVMPNFDQPPSTAPPSSMQFNYGFVQQQQQQGVQLGPATSAQVSGIYGNSSGPQDDPFSYHPPPTATIPLPPQQNNSAYNPNAAFSVAQAHLSEYDGSQRRGPTLPVRNASIEGGEYEFGRGPHRGSRVKELTTETPTFPPVGQRRPSLAIASLLSDSNELPERKTQHQQQEPQFYGHQQQQQSQGDMQSFSFGTIPSAQGQFDAYSEQPYSFAEDGAVNGPNVIGENVEWEPQHAQQQELVGAMDAKAKALLNGRYGI